VGESCPYTTVQIKKKKKKSRNLLQMNSILSVKNALTFIPKKE
jgi:hypothetical protein